MVSSPEPVMAQKPQSMPILPLVNGAYALLSRQPKILFRAGLFPFLILFLLGLWTTPPHWGPVAYYALRGVELVLVLGLWTFYARSLQRYVLLGPVKAMPGFLPRMDQAELRYGLLSLVVLSPLFGFAIYYDQPLFPHQPDLMVMGAMTAFDGMGELLYASLFLGWIMQAMAYVLPAAALDEPRRLPHYFQISLDKLRQDFSRLFAASVMVVLPAWLLFTLIRLFLHSPVVAQLALGDAASGFAWNMMFYFFETLKVFLCGGLLALLWALAYGRVRHAIGEEYGHSS